MKMEEEKGEMIGVCTRTYFQKPAGREEEVSKKKKCKKMGKESTSWTSLQCENP